MKKYNVMTITVKVTKYVIASGETRYHKCAIVKVAQEINKGVGLDLLAPRTYQTVFQHAVVLEPLWALCARVAPEKEGAETLTRAQLEAAGLETHLALTGEVKTITFSEPSVRLDNSGRPVMVAGRLLTKTSVEVFLRAGEDASAVEARVRASYAPLSAFEAPAKGFEEEGEAYESDIVPF